MHAFVTGAAGFIGTHLVRALIMQNYTVSCLVRSPAKGHHLKHKSLKLLVGDFNDLDTFRNDIKKSNIVFHVAGVAKEQNREAYFNGNLIISQQLVAAIKRYLPKGQKIVYISSQAAAGPSVTPPGVNEQTEDSLPVSAYGQSKLEAEKVFLTVTDLFPVTILRPSIVYGPRDYGMLPLFKAASFGLKIKNGFRDFPVSIIHVSDLVNAILLAAKSEKANGKTYYVSDGKSYPWATLLSNISASVNPRAITVTVPLGLLWLLCQIGGFAGRFLGTAQDLNPDKWFEIQQQGWICDTSRFQKELGFQAQWSLERGMKDTARWYRKAKWL